MAEEKGIRIILVDDNDIDIVVNTKLLKIANITEDVVSFSGHEPFLNYVLENLQEMKLLKNVVLMDIQMPEVDGFETIELLVEKFPSLLPSSMLFMLSSSIDRSDIKKAESNEHILKVLEKPLDVYQLKGLIGE